MRKSLLAALKEIIPQAPVFTTAAAAKAAGVSRDVASRDLGVAAAAGLIVRMKPGVWAVSSHPDFSPYVAVPFLVGGEQFSGLGYVSLPSALALRGMIQQLPGSVHVMVLAQRRALETPVARFEFHKLDAAVFGGFTDFGSRFSFPLATPAKALFDTLLLSVSRGRRFSYLPELRFTRAFSRREMEHWIARIRSSRLRSAVGNRWAIVRERESIERERE